MEGGVQECGKEKEAECVTQVRSQRKKRKRTKSKIRNANVYHTNKKITVH